MKRIGLKRVHRVIAIISLISSEESQGQSFGSKRVHGQRRSLQADEGFQSSDHGMQQFSENGDGLCPCLSAEALATKYTRDPLESDSVDKFLDQTVDLNRYGVGCKPHDLNSKACSSTNDDCATIPLPPSCDKSFCPRSWCYVDPANCLLLKRESILFQKLYYSYATCGDMDSFTYTERFSSLKGRTMRVALNSNTGGWKGAYHPDGSFATDDKWEGPIVDFVRNAAHEGGFYLNITSPPNFLRVESQKYFGKSSFDYCVYAAALGTTDIAMTKVSNIKEAVEAGYTFCSERKVAESVIDLHNIDPSLVVPDPVELGGDGKPGFNCPKCNSRERVFENMRQAPNDTSLYCNAAFVTLGDLQVLHESREHCDKTVVGDVLALTNEGIPIYDGNNTSSSLLALFHRMENDGKMDMQMREARPDNNCPVQEGEGHALSIEQLTGIWMITFTLAAASLVAKLFQRWYTKRKTRTKMGTKVVALQCYDQWSNETDHDVFIKGKLYDPHSVKNEFHNIDETNRMIRESFGGT